MHHATVVLLDSVNYPTLARIRGENMFEKRRSESRPGGDDRRKIARFQNSSVKNNFIYLRRWMLGFLVLSLIAGISTIVSGMLHGATEFTRYLFIATFFFLAAIPFFQYSKAIQFYIDNESVTNLEGLSEKEVILWKTLGIISFMMLINYLIIIF